MKFLRGYELVGSIVVLGVYLWTMLFVWIGSIANGTYSVTIYTNIFGEADFELGILLVFLPAAMVHFVRVIHSFSPKRAKPISPTEPIVTRSIKPPS